MADEKEGTKEAKSKTVYTTVKMSDGREVQFPGKRKVQKETIINESLIELDEAAGIIQLQRGAVAVRMDFLNGETRTLPLSLSLLARFAGHGAEQKYGDELATTADNPMTEEDMVLAIDDLHGLLEKGEWGRGRAAGGGGVSGASVVVKAIMEVTGKSIDFVKGFLQQKLDKDKDLTRRALYDSFRAPGSKTAPVIKRMEEEKLAKTAKVDAGAALEEMTAG